MFTIYDDIVLVYKGTTFGVNNAVVLEFAEHYAIQAFDNIKKYSVSMEYNLKHLKQLLGHSAVNVSVISDSTKYDICEICDLRFKHFTGGCNPGKYCDWKSSDAEVFSGNLELDIQGIYLPTNYVVPSKRYFTLRDAVWNLGSYSTHLLKQMKEQPFITTPAIDAIINQVHGGSRWDHGIPYLNGWFERRQDDLTLKVVDPWNGKTNYDDNWKYARPYNQEGREMLAYLVTKYKLTKGDDGTVTDIEIPGLGSLRSISWNESYTEKRKTIPTLMVYFQRDGLLYEERFSHSNIQTRI